MSVTSPILLAKKTFSVVLQKLHLATGWDMRVRGFVTNNQVRKFTLLIKLFLLQNFLDFNYCYWISDFPWRMMGRRNHPFSFKLTVRQSLISRTSPPRQVSWSTGHNCCPSAAGTIGISPVKTEQIFKTWTYTSFDAHFTSGLWMSLSFRVFVFV